MTCLLLGHRALALPLSQALESSSSVSSNWRYHQRCRLLPTQLLTSVQFC